jgi:serine/threonine-protein kinase
VSPQPEIARRDTIPPNTPASKNAYRRVTDTHNNSRRTGFKPMIPTANAPTISLAVAGFLATVRSANLFTPSQQPRVEATIPAEAATAAEAANALVSAGFLTRFQADRLLAGKTDGFHLGPYAILEQVGHGALGRVYKARHRTMNRSVAIKVLASELTRTVAERQAYQQAVRAVAQLNHQNIVTTYDANELADRFYLVVEFVDGPNFEVMVRERGPLPVHEACELVRQAAAGLEHAHSRGMLHRNIKPTNLLVVQPSKTSPDHLVKIADFGLAKLSPAQALAQGVSWLGTLDYAAPELAHNAVPVDHRADLYSLGAVLYFLLTGRAPFAGGTAEDKVRRHMWEEAARIELLRPDVPPALAMLVHQLLAKYPGHRPASAAEVADRLAAITGSAGEVVHFDLPVVPAVPYSHVTGPLSGGRLIPMMDQTPHPVAFPVPVPQEPEPQTSPFEQMTEPAPLSLDDDEEPRPSPRGKRRGMPMWLVGSLALCVLAMTLAGVGMLIKTMGK